MMRMRESAELTGTRTRGVRALVLCALFCAWSGAAIGCTGLKDGSDTAAETGSPDAEADADRPGDGDGDGDGDRDGGGDAGAGSDACEGRDGTTFCVGDSIRSCPGSVDEPCSGDDQCVDLNGAGLCVCAVGSAASASCAPAEECGADNGGCDSLTACALIGGEPACGSCPVGFTGNGLDGCVATLIGITVANGELLTAIAPETTAYEARVSVFERRAHVTFQIPAEASLEIDGASVDASEPWSSKVLEAGENAFDLRLDVPGHAQVRFDLVLRREAVQRAYIKADPPAVDDGFGRVVCLDGDQLLVGNFVEDRRGMASTALRDTGSAYIFEHTESGWEQQAYLKPETLTRDAWFGSSVILRGDVALISALQQDGGGAVYTFTRSGSTWTEGQVLESGTPLTDSWFGLDMVLQDDLLFVGEPYVGAGRIYLFKRETEGFTQQAVLRSSRNQTDGNFGSAIAVSGDTMVASATFDGTGLNVGAAYVFEREGEDWNESQRLVGRNTTDGDEFGYALDMRGDLIAIGGPYNEARGLDAGAVYIFERSGSQWVEQTMLVASNGGALYNFGISVKFLADDLLVIGSTGESSSLSTMDPDESNASASAAGAIYVFGRNGDDWVQEAYIKAAFPGENDAFGTSLSFSNGRLAVGAYQESGGSSGVNGDQLSDTSSASGAVYLFE